MRRIAAAVTAGLFVLAVAAPATGTQAGRGESPGSPPGTASKESGEASRGTGVLPNMAVEGDGLVRLQVGAFDPTRDRGPVQSGIPHVDESTLDSAVEYPWLVQVRDRRYAEVSDAIAGARFVGAIPDDTYLIRATTAQRAELAASPAVRWSGLLQPAWKLPVAAGGRQGILALPGTQTYRVYAFRSDPAAAEVGQALARMAGVQVVSDATVVVDVRATARQLPAIAALPGVQYVGTRPTAVPLNADSRWVNDTGIRDLYAATAPGRLTGAGQTAAVADTGINYDYDMNGRAHAASGTARTPPRRRPRPPAPASWPTSPRRHREKPKRS